MGKSGSGKSSYINAVYGLTADDPGAAAVDVVECTTKGTPYLHPDNPNLKYWDLPGVGTPNYEHDDYLNRVGINSFDYFVIICSDRFTQYIWFANEIKKKDKRFFFVRAKVDQDLNNHRRSHPSSHNEEKVIQTMRDDIKTKLNDAGFDLPNIYLISNFEPKKWDFIALNEATIDCLQKEKHDALTMTLTQLSIGIINKKKNIMHGMTLQTAAYAAIELPLSSSLSQIQFPTGQHFEDVLFQRLNIYKKQFGLDEYSLTQLAHQTNKSEKVFFDIAKTAGQINAQGLSSLLTQFGINEKVLECLPQVVLIIGSVIATPYFFTKAYLFLEKVLNELEKEAIAVIEFAIKENTSND